MQLICGGRGRSEFPKKASASAAGGAADGEWSQVLHGLKRPRTPGASKKHRCVNPTPIVRRPPRQTCLQIGMPRRSVRRGLPLYALWLQAALLCWSIPLMHTIWSALDACPARRRAATSRFRHVWLSTERSRRGRQEEAGAWLLRALRGGRRIRVRIGKKRWINPKNIVRSPV